MEHPVLVLLFLASILVVLVWLVQYSLDAVRLWRCWRRKQSSLWTRRGLVLDLLRWPGRSRSEVGLKGLLTSLLSFKTFREEWLGSWLQALNQQAHGQQSSVQITFESGVKVAPSSSIDRVTCTSRSARGMVLLCQCRVDVVTFPVTVTQQSPVVVTMDIFQITVSPAVVEIQVCLEEMEGGGLLVTWSVSKPSSFCLRATPRKHLKKLKDIDTIQRLTEDALFSSQPALVLDLRPVVSRPGSFMDPAAAGDDRTKQRCLLIRMLRVTFSKGYRSRQGELCCVLNLHPPSTQKSTSFLPLPETDVELVWSEEISLSLSPESRELQVRLLERLGKREEFLPGHAAVDLNLQHKVPTTVTLLLGSGPGSPVKITAELVCTETDDVPSSLTPNKVGVNRTVMGDGTVVTRVTTVQPTLRPDHSSDPVADTAIRQLTECRFKTGARKTPTRRSTLIISGVAKVPLTDNDLMVSKDYAASMEEVLQLHRSGSGRQTEPGPTKTAALSGRPSLDDVDSDTGSTGVSETRSLKDHRAGFLPRAMWFRRRRGDTQTSISHSHEDVSNISSSSSCRKKSGSFSRRLIKRFSFRTSKKSEGRAGYEGKSAVEN
ncbi:phospholipid transfer protein C2CD2L [Synchiropus splendidus]|uniref:phospholipid transfer protein C2CD2L n=1 Tax=Synchiropus splendidus TaxID=270530 RepID=UPI00237EBB69|nr:phospholipid transfer protein C2CD2L [Synchiropus splendidus]